jgi:hypothetical protein
VIRVSEQGGEVSVTIEAPYEGTVSELSAGDRIHSLAAMLSGEVKEVLDDKRAKVEFRFSADCDE